LPRFLSTDTVSTVTSAAFHESASPALRNARVLWLCIVASITVHIAVLLAMPATRSSDPKRPEVLEVTLEKVEPPRVVPPAVPRAATPPSVRTPVRKETPRPRPAPPAAMPDTMSPPAPPLLTVPEAQPLRAPSVQEAEAPARMAAPTGETAERQEGPRAQQRVEKPIETTPPSFNAAYLRNPPPRYPISARRRGEQGTVTLRVLVARDGAPVRVSLETTSGSGSLDEAALEAVRNWRFVPARQGGQAVEAWVLVPIVFKLDGGS
jgi:protein TonB